MIVCQLQGGLGNQMFQYATARTLANRHSTKVVLDHTWLVFKHPVGGATQRKYELDCFKLRKTTRQLSRSLPDRLRMKFATRYQEPDVRYDAGFLKQPNNTFVQGHFQTERYFSSIRAQLLEDFSWADAPKGKNKTLLNKIQLDDSSVSIHVRRGDYITNPNASQLHGLLGIAYYQSALKAIRKHVAKPNLYVFSDDPVWCKANLKFDFPTTYIAHNTDGAEDMRLMKSCRHNIVANSSFSWWAAWLNENPQKLVVAPKRWFAKAESNTKAVVPASWLQV